MKRQWMALTTRIEAADKGTAPAWVRLFAAGWGQLADGVKFLVDQDAFDAVRAYVAGRGNDLVFDYEHQSLKDMEAPAAGWVKELKWEADQGIMARVDWTSRGNAYVSGKEYRYFSPVFFIRKTDSRVVGLHSVALTNTPKTNNLTPILAKLGLAESIPNAKEATMNKAQLIAALELPENATGADIQAAIAKLGVKPPEKQTIEVPTEVLPKEVVAALDLDGTDQSVSTVVASIHALKQGVGNTVTKAEFDALQKKILDRDVTDAVTAAIAKGKITPDQKEWAMAYAMQDLAGFNTFVAKAPQVIPVDKLPGHTQEADKTAQESATMQVASMMGLDADDLKKYGEVTHG